MVPMVGLEALASWCGVIRTVVVAVVETPTPMLRQPTLAAPVVVVRVRDQGSPLLAAVQRTLAAAAVERGAVQAARRLALVAQESSSFDTSSKENGEGLLTKYAEDGVTVISSERVPVPIAGEVADTPYQTLAIEAVMRYAARKAG